MTKLDDYNFKTKQILRYGDTDRQGHVNNAVFATLFESGRVPFLYDKAANLPPQGHSFVLAQINIAFLREILWPGDVWIGTRIGRIGSSSITLEQAIFCDDTIHAKAESVVVFTSLAARKSTPMPDSVRTHFEALI